MAGNRCFGEILLPSQQDAVAALVRKSGLDPRKFQWTRGFSAVHIQSDKLEFERPDRPGIPWSFSFDFSKEYPGWFQCEWSPALDRLTYSATMPTWEGVETAFQQWLGALKRESKAGHRWAELLQSFQNEFAHELPLESGDEPVGVKDIEVLTKALEEFRAEVRPVLAGVGERLEDFEGSLRFLLLMGHAQLSASDRLLGNQSECTSAVQALGAAVVTANAQQSRSTFIYTVVGMLVPWAVGLGLTQEEQREYLKAVWALFKRLAEAFR